MVCDGEPPRGLTTNATEGTGSESAKLSRIFVAFSDFPRFCGHDLPGCGVQVICRNELPLTNAPFYEYALAMKKRAMILGAAILVALIAFVGLFYRPHTNTARENANRNSAATSYRIGRRSSHRRTRVYLTLYFDKDRRLEQTKVEEVPTR
jgi:hypothetical protein